VGIRDRLRALPETTRVGFVKMLDTENVKLYVWPYYLTLWAFGFCSIISTVPLTYVWPVMGDWFYQAWIAMMIVGTTLVMVGLLWRNKYTGLLLQRGGNASMALVLAAYEVAAFDIWGPAAFSFFAIAPYVLGCCFLTMTCVRKLWLIKRVHSAGLDGEEDPGGSS
jgi:hypothetical protein